MMYYLPGCDVRALHPDAVRKMQKYISSLGIETAVCCRKDIGYITDEDTMIQNCTLCDMVLRERIPNNTVLSLYEYLLMVDFPFPDYSGKTVTLQDCWRTRENRARQDAVRECLMRMNIRFLEMPENRENSRYCGVWLNNPIAPDLPVVTPVLTEALAVHRHLLEPEEQKARMQEWVKQYTTEEIVTYCNGCERGIRLGGGHPLAMIELLARDLPV